MSKAYEQMQTRAEAARVHAFFDCHPGLSERVHYPAIVSSDVGFYFPAGAPPEVEEGDIVILELEGDAYRYRPAQEIMARPLPAKPPRLDRELRTR